MDKKTLALLKAVSEQLAEWSALNDGCLHPKLISNHEQRQLERLELRIEEAIMAIDTTWPSV